MRQAKLVNTPLLPGVVSDDTDLAAKGRFIDADKVVFRGGRPETIGGWSAFNASGVASGKARGMHSWTTLDGLPVVAAATETAMYAWINGSRVTITPKWVDVWLEDPFSSTSGSATYTCEFKVHTVSTGGVATAANHYLQVGDVVTFSNGKRTVGNRSMNITATITAVPNSTSFQFTHPSGTANADTSGVGDEILLTVAYRAGLATGTGDTAMTRPRIWSLDNFGEELVAVASDGSPLFFWTPETDYSELITNGTFATDSNWAKGTGWTIAAGVASHAAGTAANLSQAVTGVLEGGRLYELSFTTTAYTGGGPYEFDVLIDSTTIFPKFIRDEITDDATMTWTTRFVCPANPTNLIFSATSNNTAISIDDVSVKLVAIASPVNEAPQKSYGMFVDGNRILHLLGTIGAGGDFNALLDRWSDQDNMREWVPDTDNLAGEFPIGRGSHLVGGAVVGERNLILTNDTAYSMTFTGNSGSVYSIAPVASACGLIGRNALSTFSGRAFWVSRNGFHSYDGGQIQTIECPVRNRMFGYLPQYQENKTFTWINTARSGEWWIHYPHSSDGTETSRYLVFNFIEDRNPWSVGTFNRTAMARAGTFAYPIGVDTSGNIWSHETGMVMSGAGITLPFIETGYLTSADGDKWVGCRRYVPDFEEQEGNLNFTITFKRRPQGQLNTTTLGPFLCREGEEKIDFLGRGRQMKLKWASVPTTTKWRLGIVGLEVLLDQERQ